MKKFHLLVLSLFFLGISNNINSQTPEFYITGTLTEVTNFLPNQSYYLVYDYTGFDSSKISWEGRLKSGAFSKTISVNLNTSSQNSFSLTQTDINNLSNSNITLDIIRNINGICSVCVRLCDTDSAEFQNGPCVTSSVPTNFPNLGLVVNQKTITPSSIEQVQLTNCVSNTNIQVQFNTNEIFSTTYKWYKNNELFSTTSQSTSAFTSINNNDVISVTHTETGFLESEKLSTTVSVLQKPEAPTVNTFSSVCKGDVFQLTANTTSESIEWFEDASLTNQITTGLTDNGKNINYLGNFTGSKTLYLRGKTNDCFSNLTSVEITVFDNPQISSIIGQNESVCGNSINLKINGTNINAVKWYNGIEGLPTQLISINNAFTYNITNLPNGTNSIFYIAETVDGCKTDISKVDFTKLASAGNVATVAKTTYCKNEQVNISLSSATSVRYEWFEDQAMNVGAPISYQLNNGQGFSYQANTVGSKKWYYRGVNSQGCFTQLYELNIITNNSPENLSITNAGATFCTNTIASFEASATGAASYKFYKNNSGTLEWGTSNVSGNKLSINGSDLNIGENRFWYKAVNSSGCETPIKEVSFFINQAPNQPLRSSGSLIYCLNETVKITVFSASANSYQWSYTSDFNNLVEASKIVNSDSSLLQYQANTTGTTRYYYRSVANGCFSDFNTLDVTINPQVGAVTVSNNGGLFCQGETVELIAGATNATSGFAWFTDAQGTIPASNITGINNNTYRLVTSESTLTGTTTESSPIGTTTLYVRGINASGCNSELTEVSYTIKTTPYNLQVVGETDYCTGDTVQLTPSANNATSYEWALDSNFNNKVDASKVSANGLLTYKATTAENTTYFYRALNTSGCATASKSVTVKVLQGVSNLAITNNAIAVCKGETIVFVATANNATSYKFFDQNGAQIGTSNSLSINSSTLDAKTYNYQVQAFNSNGCNSNALNFSFTVYPKPNTPTVSGTTTYCNGEQVLLTATSAGATLFKWYSDSALNNEITANLSGSKNEIYSFGSTITGTKSYYVVSQNDGTCISEAKQISITINPQVGAVTVSNNGGSFCQGETVELIAGATNATSGFAWFTDAQGTIPASNITGTNNNTYRLVTNENTPNGITTLYVRGINASGCNSELTEVNYTINAIPKNVTLEGNTIICLSETVNITVNANFTDTFLWFLDINELNPINLSWLTSDNGSTIQFTPTIIGEQRLYYKAINDQGCESQLKTVEITVNQKPTQLDVTNNNVPFCENEIASFEASAFNVSYFEWWKNKELTLPLEVDFISGATKNKVTINPFELEKGTYTYYLVGVNNSGCKSETKAVSFSINDIPLKPSVSGASSVCLGEILDMTVISNGATSYKWYYDNEKNIPVNPLFVIGNGSQIKIPANQQEKGTLYVEGVNNNGCSSELLNFAYDFNIAPLNLSVTPLNQNICVGQEISIEAVADSSTEFLWWKNAQATIPVEQEKIIGLSKNKVVFTTTEDNIGTTSYFVQAKNQSGCVSEIKEVKFTVLPLPVIEEFLTNSEDFQFLFNNPIQFNFNASNYNQYRILKEGIPILNWTEGTITTYNLTNKGVGADSGTYTFEVSNGNCTESKSITIYVLDVEVEIIHNKQDNIVIEDGFERIQIIQGDEITFNTNFESDNYIYEWDFGDSFSNDKKISKHYYNVDGLYKVNLKLTNKDTQAVRDIELKNEVLVLKSDDNININPLDIPEDSQISFAPNPFKNKLSFILNNLNTNKKVVIRIYDINGINYFVETLSAFAGDNTFSWNNPLGNAPQGVYVVRLLLNDEIKTFKLVKTQ